MGVRCFCQLCWQIKRNLVSHPKSALRKLALADVMGVIAFYSLLYTDRQNVINQRSAGWATLRSPVFTKSRTNRPSDGVHTGDNGFFLLAAFLPFSQAYLRLCWFFKN